VLSWNSLPTGIVLLLGHQTLRNDTQLVPIAQDMLQHANRVMMSRPKVPPGALSFASLDNTGVAKVPEKMK